MKKSINKQLLFGALLIIICFVIALKALSSITTVIFEGINIVCLDPGHGGDDVGALHKNGRCEKDDNLTLALKVKAELEKKDVRVIMTRESDESVSLKNRCKAANRGRADLFVSLHRNSSVSGTGMEVWIKDVPTDEETALADDVLRSLADVSGLPSRGVKRGYRDSTGNNYYVNANTNMPSCLVEVGFISNQEDNKNFDKNINAYAEAIAQAIYENLQ